MLFADFVNSANIRVIQSRSSAGLAAKTLKRHLVASDIIREKLKSYETPQLCVFGFVNHTHATASQLLQNAVVRNGLAEWRWGGHGADMLAETVFAMRHPRPKLQSC